MSVKTTAILDGLSFPSSEVPTELDGTNDFSIILWFKPAASIESGIRAIFATGDGTDPQVYIRKTNADPPAIQFRGNDGSSNKNATPSGGTLVAGEVHLFACSYDATAKSLTAWMQRENQARTTGSQTWTNQLISATGASGGICIGDCNPIGLGSAQPGQWECCVIRNHTIDADDFDAIWDSKSRAAPYNLDNTGTGGNMNGTTGAIWGTPWGPFSGPSNSNQDKATGSIVGNYIGDTITGDHGVSGDSSLSLLRTSGGGTPSSSIRDIRDVAAENVTWTDPFDEAGWSTFFTLQKPGTYTGSTFVLPARSMPAVAALAQNIAPSGYVPLLAHANSRGGQRQDGHGTSIGPGSFGHGFITYRKALTAGTCFKPCDDESGHAHFGFDCEANAPSCTNCDDTTDAGNEPLRDVGRFWINSSSSFSVGKGIRVRASTGEYQHAFKPEASSLCPGDGSDSLTLEFLVLRLPGDNSFDVEKGKTTAQNVAHTSLGETVSKTATASFDHTLTASEATNSSTTSIEIQSDVSASITINDACVLTDSSDLIQGASLVTNVVWDGSKTTITLEKALQNAPASTNKVKFGEWSFEWVGHTFTPVDYDASATWRSIRVNNVGTPGVGVIIVGARGYNPNVSGYGPGSIGWGGNGFNDQLTASHSTAAVEDELSPVSAFFRAILGSSGNGIKWSCPATQNVSVDEETDWNAYLAVVEAGIGATREIVLAADFDHQNDDLDEWHTAGAAVATSRGHLFVSALESDVGGTFIEQLAKGYRSDQTSHYSEYGAAACAEAWLTTLSPVANAIEGGTMEGRTARGNRTLRTARA